MKNLKIKLVLLLTVPFFLLLRCSEDKIEPPYLKINTESINFPKDSNSRNIIVESNVEWSFDVSLNAEWLTVIKKENTLNVKTTENTTTDTRTANINIKGKGLTKKVSVKQLGQTPSILVSHDSFSLESKQSKIVITINSNIDYTVFIPENIKWITQESVKQDEKNKFNRTYTFAIDWNTDETERTAELSIKQNEGSLEEKVIIVQKGQSEYTGGTIEEPDFLKVPVSSATSSSVQSGNNINKTYDGDLTTVFRSQRGSNIFPVTLEYFFENQESINHFIYHPEAKSKDGNFGKAEIWVTTKENPTPKKIMNYDFKGFPSATKITFDEPIANPTSIKIILTSGGQIVSCAEMEFYRKNPESFDASAFFTDETCSELKVGITEEQIRQIQSSLYRNIALYLLKEKYPKEFRIQEYKAWPIPDDWLSISKTYFAYSLLDNPSGISVDKDEELIVFMGDTHNHEIRLKVQNLDKPGGDGYGPSFFYTLKQGINKITIKEKGLIYVNYHTPNYQDAPKIKIHFATGKVNGYFDSQKHSTADWSRLLNNATNKYFDILGKYSHLTFPTEAFKSYANTNGPELITAYDKLVYDSHEFMGLMKYNKRPGNRAYFHVMYHQYMYATSYRIGANVSILSSLLDVNQFKTTAIWGPAHELGHVHQIRHGFRWIGTSEVTNNVQSLYIQTLWGNESRLEKDNIYESAFNKAFVKNIIHGEEEDVFAKLVNFWQLELYFAKTKGQIDFYKDLYEKLRVSSPPSSHGQAQLNFIKFASDISKTDLTVFFTKWGLLSPINKVIIDNKVAGRLEVTQQDIDKTIADIKSHKYTIPDKIEYICDSNWTIYRDKKTVVKGTATKKDRSITMTNWQNVVAYEVWEGEKLVFVSNRASFTLEEKPLKSIKVYAIAYNGDRTEVTF